MGGALVYKKECCGGFGSADRGPVGSSGPQTEAVGASGTETEVCFGIWSANRVCEDIGSAD